MGGPRGVVSAGGPPSAGGGAGGGASAGGAVRSQGHKSGRGGGEHKPTRVRTVLNEKQLHTLRTCYAANPRPDALMKEQLVEMTGLSPRVIRVWFQNKRCKDKKRSIMIKQMQQSEKVLQLLSHNEQSFERGQKFCGYCRPSRPLGVALTVESGGPLWP